MSITSFLLSNPEIVADGIGAILAIFGVKAWRTKAKASTVAVVDRWASTAAGTIVLLVRSGLIDDHAEAVERFLSILRQLARAAGIEIRVEHEHRALGHLHTVLAAVGPDLVADELRKVAGLAKAAGERMARLPFPGTDGAD
jgi:hypothetical protein